MNNRDETIYLQRKDVAQKDQAVAVLDRTADTEPELHDDATETEAHKGNGYEHGVLHLLVSPIVAVYDWLSGPPMSEQERLQREIYESRHDTIDKYLTY